MAFLKYVHVTNIYKLSVFWFWKIFLGFLQEKDVSMVSLLKFWTLVVCRNGLDKQHKPRSNCFWRRSLIMVFPVCYSDKHFVNFSLDNKLFIWKQNKKCSKSYLPYCGLLVIIWPGPSLRATIWNLQVFEYFDRYNHATTRLASR